MIRVVIDRVVIDGLPGLREADVRRHLEREIARTLADLHTVDSHPGRPSPVTVTQDSKALARSVAYSLREVLDGG